VRDGFDNRNDLLGVFFLFDIMSTQGDIYFAVKIKWIASVLGAKTVSESQIESSA
jgi:hypothetical protein